MAGAEARALWQRTANRCFVQEDAKRLVLLLPIYTIRKILNFSTEQKRRKTYQGRLEVTNSDCQQRQTQGGACMGSEPHHVNFF